MDLTVTVEEYGFMMFPEVFDGPAWASYPVGATEDVAQPRGHVATLRVDASTALGDILNRAAAEFGMSLSQQTLKDRPRATVADRIDGVAFYAPGDEHEAWLPKSRFVRRLPAIDSAGSLWMKDYREVAMEELERAGSLDLIEGHALHPYLRPAVSAGAMGVAAGEWAIVLEALRYLWHALDALAPLGTLPTLAWLGQPILKRLHRSADAVQTTSPQLAVRGIRPGELAVILSRRQWNPEECGLLLGMTENDAIQYLAVLGFEPNEGGVWEMKSQLAAALVRASVDIATQSETDLLPAMQARIEYLVQVTEKSGRPPGLQDIFSESVWSWDDPEDEEDVDEVEGD
jgi:hypothetical protein